MHAKLLRALKWSFGATTGGVVLGAQTSATDAASNLASWFGLFGLHGVPPVVAGIPLDAIGTYGGGIGFTVAVAWIFWPTRFSVLEIRPDENQYSGSGEGPGFWQSRAISVRNTADETVANCQIELDIRDEQTRQPVSQARIVVTAPFNLRPSESLRVPIINMNFDNPTAHANVRRFVNLPGNGWTAATDNLHIRPGAYIVRVTALSDGSKPASAKLALRHSPEGWGLSRR